MTNLPRVSTAKHSPIGIPVREPSGAESALETYTLPDTTHNLLVYPPFAG